MPGYVRGLDLAAEQIAAVAKQAGDDNLAVCCSCGCICISLSVCSRKNLCVGRVGRRVASPDFDIVAIPLHDAEAELLFAKQHAKGVAGACHCGKFQPPAGTYSTCRELTLLQRRYQQTHLPAQFQPWKIDLIREIGDRTVAAGK